MLATCAGSSVQSSLAAGSQISMGREFEFTAAYADAGAVVGSNSRQIHD
jgi:hypothetical protein